MSMRDRVYAYRVATGWKMGFPVQNLVFGADELRELATYFAELAETAHDPPTADAQRLVGYLKESGWLHAKGQWWSMCDKRGTIDPYDPAEHSLRTLAHCRFDDDVEAARAAVWPNR